MFTWQEKSDQYIYHYTKAETAIEFILKNNNLRLSPFTKTNDPKETKDWFFIPGTNQERNLDKYNPEYLSKLLNPMLKQKTSLLCFSTDKNLTGNHLVDMPNRGFCKPRMWAQYGGNHTGICLIFDTLQFSDLFYKQFSNKYCFSGMVNYQDRLIHEIQQEQAFIVNVDNLEESKSDDYAFNHLCKFKNRLYFEKSTDWKNEDEFRFVVFDCADELYFEYKNSLSGIMFGAGCTNEDISKICNLTKHLGLEYQQLNWRNCTPWFDFGRTKWL